MLVVPAQSIKIPSDFAIVVDSMTDSNGNAIDISTAFIGFKFYCNGKTYECVSDPQNNNHIKTKIVNGELWLLFDDYPFDSTGYLSYIQHDRVADDKFESGYNDTYSALEQTKIRLVR